MTLAFINIEPLGIMQLHGKNETNKNKMVNEFRKSYLKKGNMSAIS